MTLHSQTLNNPRVYTPQMNTQRDCMTVRLADLGGEEVARVITGRTVENVGMGGTGEAKF